MKKECEGALPWSNGAGGSINTGCAGILILFLVISVLFSCQSTGAWSEDHPLVIPSYYPDDIPMWDHIMGTDPAFEFNGDPGGIIIPHHVIASTVVARFYRGLAQRIHPRTIVVLSPDHFETGPGDITTTASAKWDTVYGTLEPDRQAVSMLLQSGLSMDSAAPFNGEHGIFFHAPFIKRFFPQACIVPVLIKWDTPKETLSQLAECLNAVLPADVPVIASVDFSHYNRREIADFHDAASFTSISNFDYDALFALEIDSPASVFVLEKIMAARGYTRAVRVYNTNSEDFTRVREPQTTSHLYFAFFHGDTEYQRHLDIMIPGAIRISNRHLFVKDKWLWDRTYDYTHDTTIDRFLKNIRGQEDRFFMGADVYIFDLPSENTVYSIMKNDVTVKMIKFSNTDLPLSDMLSRVRELSNTCDCMILLFDFPAAINPVAAESTATQFIKNGADIFIGRNALLPMRVETVENGLVVYSAGDFITAGTDSIGTIVLAEYNRESIRFTRFPVRVKNGMPEPEPLGAQPK